MPHTEERRVAFEFRGCRLRELFTEAVAQEQGYMCPRFPLFERAYVNVREQIGGREVTIFYQLRNRKLAGVVIVFPPDDYPVILTSFVEQYGAPHRRTSEAVRNRTGTPSMNVHGVLADQRGRADGKTVWQHQGGWLCHNSFATGSEPQGQRA